MSYRAELQRAIKHNFGCDSSHVVTTHVKEVFGGKVAWQGDVEVFALKGHPHAATCYAWGVRSDDDKAWDVTTVLGLPPAVSPETAVRAVIDAHVRQAASQRSRNA